MTIHLLEREMKAPTRLDQTFSIFENPYNLARITPPWLRFRIVNPPPVQMKTGAEIDYEMRWLLVPIRWRTLITAYEPPFLFADEQIRGPYALWRHTHAFRPEEGGTVVLDQVEYALPFGPLGNLAHSLIVRRQLEQIFDFRHAALAELFREASATGAK